MPGKRKLKISSFSWLWCIFLPIERYCFYYLSSLQRTCTFLWNSHDYQEIIQIIYDIVWLPGKMKLKNSSIEWLWCVFYWKSFIVVTIGVLYSSTVNFFCMKLAWLPGNHANPIWPCMITGKNETQELIVGWHWCVFFLIERYSCYD